MKKILPILFFCALLSFVNAQTYRPLGGRLATWQLYNTQLTGWSNPPTINHYFAMITDSIIGDTLMNNKHYFMLQGLGLFYECAYRSDSLGHYYFRSINDTTDHLVCDLSAQAGDTVPNIAFYEYAIDNPSTINGYHDIVVDTTYTFSPYGKPLKVVSGHTVDSTTFSIYYSGHVNVVWIETIGALNGIVNTLSCWAYDEEISCMSMNDTTWYRGSIGNHFWNTSPVGPCNIDVDGIVSADSKANIIVSPNPFTSTVRLLNAPGLEFSFELYSVTGQCVLRKTGMKPELDGIPEIPDGLYLLRWSSDRESGSQLLMRQ